VINQISERLCGAGSMMLSPSWLIDRLLDQIDRLGCALMLVEADELSCRRIKVERRFD
jgi:hypothetical protein